MSEKEDLEYKKYMEQRQKDCPEHNYCNTWTITLDDVQHEIINDKPNQCTRCGKVKFDDVE